MFFALIMALASSHAPTATSSCLGSLGRVLAVTQFSGSLDCVHDRLSAAYIGKVLAGAHRFDIYDYRYKLVPTCVECAVHGGQRLIMLRDGKYLGQYKPDGVTVQVVANRLRLTPTGPRSTASDGRAVSVSFTEAGPPTSVFVGGDVLHLFQ